MKKMIKPALGAGLAVAICLAPLAARAADPIRVGLLTTRSGPLAAAGKQLEDGFDVFLKERGGVLEGRPIEVIVGDTGGQPAQALIKAQELVERQKVDFLIGPLAAFEALAVRDYVRQKEIPQISPAASAEDLTQRLDSPWYARTSGSSAQAPHALANYAIKNLGYRKAILIGDDFAYGHESLGGFTRVFQDEGGEIVQRIWVPLNTTDYASYLAQLRPDADVIVASFIGQNAVRFLRQYKEFGLKLPLLATPVMTDESVLKTMTDDVVGVISSSHYSASIDNPVNKKFVSEMVKRTGALPGFYAAYAYSTGQTIELALKAVGGRLEDKSAFMKAFRAAKNEHDIRGTLSFDQHGNAVESVFILKVVKSPDGKPVTQILKEYPNVSQFWTYDPNQFLKNPVYSRDFPAVPSSH